jgi:UDP-N-acetylmuramate dehydrogenase
VTILGVGSNTLIRDGGIPGVSIRLGDGFSEIKAEDYLIQAGAGASNLKIANAARDHSLAGFEFLSGIPGGLGGSIRMNAGAFGRETGEMVEKVCGLTRSGDEVQFTRQDMAFSYRQTDVDADVIFTDATLRGQPGDRDTIMRRMEGVQAERERSQPVKQATGGSTFVNPEGGTAWELIDQAGCRGLRRGNAQVSEKHCNFLINQGGASAADLEWLGEDVRCRVQDQTGIKLEWEIKRIGVYAGAGPREVAS